MLPIVAFIGTKDSGKTYIITEVCRRLGSKYRFLAVKHIPHRDFTIDSRKDTSLLREACKYSAYYSESMEFGLIIKDINFEKFRSLIIGLKNLLNTDLILFEGFSRYILRDEDIPKIVCVKDIEEYRYYHNLDICGIHMYCTLHSINNDFIKIPDNINIVINFIEKFINIYKIYEQLPRINCGKCGLSCWKLAEKIFTGKASLRDCKVLSQDKVKLKVDNVEIQMNKFVQDLFKNIIDGFIKSLKGVPDKYSTVSIEIRY